MASRSQVKQWAASKGYVGYRYALPVGLLERYNKEHPHDLVHISPLDYRPGREEFIRAGRNGGEACARIRRMERERRSGLTTSGSGVGDKV
jgi:hypothetical protein